MLDARSVVRDGDADLAVGGKKGRLHGPAASTGVRRVQKQVEEDLHDLILDDVHHGRLRGDIPLQGELLGLVVEPEDLE